MRSTVLTLCAAIATVSTTPVFAHAKLLAASPAANAVVAPPARLHLLFSERLIAQFSGGDLWMIEMAGRKMSTPMKVPTQVSFAQDVKALNLTPAKPLARGAYRLNWHVVSADTHRVQGSVSFKVK